MYTMEVLMNYVVRLSLVVVIMMFVCMYVCMRLHGLQKTLPVVGKIPLIRGFVTLYKGMATTGLSSGAQQVLHAIQTLLR